MTYWNLGAQRLNKIISKYIQTTYINPITAHGTKLTAVAGGIVVLVPLKIAGKLAFTSLVSKNKNNLTKSTCLMYFTIELGYFRVITKGIIGAIAPMRKKKVRAENKRPVSTNISNRRKDPVAYDNKECLLRIVIPVR